LPGSPITYLKVFRQISGGGQVQCPQLRILSPRSLLAGNPAGTLYPNMWLTTFATGWRFDIRRTHPASSRAGR
jgi:hypothetical protein